MIAVSHYKNIALGLLLAGAGFLGGYLTGEHGGPFQQANAMAPPGRAHVAPPGPGRMTAQGRVVEMYWSSENPNATVVVVERGQPLQVHQRHAPVLPQDPTMTHSAPPRTKQHATMLALLLLTGMPFLTWAALAWNRRRSAGRHLAEPAQEQEFVPRRDD